MTVDCPVCRRRIHANRRGRVWVHNDKAKHPCPMSGHIYPIDDEERRAA